MAYDVERERVIPDPDAMSCRTAGNGEARISASASSRSPPVSGLYVELGIK